MSTPETIVVNGKWHSAARRIDRLTWNQRDALETHRRHLAAGEPILLGLGFTKESETAFFRGQPETRFNNGRVAVYLVGLAHWQVFFDGVQARGTGKVENLAIVATAALERGCS